MELQYRTIYDFVIAYMRNAILEGDLKPGSLIDQSKIAEKINVSRTPVRQAMRELESEGLVILRPHSVGIVAPLSVDEAEELYLMRSGLEEYMSAEGTLKLDEAGLNEMKRIFSEMKKTAAEPFTKNTVKQFYKLDSHFHEIHYTAAQKPLLYNRIFKLREMCQRYTRTFWNSQHSIEITEETHGEIIAACEARDGARAGQCMLRDIKDTLTDLKKYMMNESV